MSSPCFQCSKGPSDKERVRVFRGGGWVSLLCSFLDVEEGEGAFHLSYSTLKWALKSVGFSHLNAGKLINANPFLYD